MSSPISRRAILKGGAALVAAAALPTRLWRRTGGPVWVPGASASPGVVLDPNDPLANFTAEGPSNAFTPGSVLFSNDSSNSIISNFFGSSGESVGKRGGGRLRRGRH